MTIPTVPTTRVPSTLEARAREFAIERHADQKYGHTLPYSVHLAHVVAVLDAHDEADPDVFAAGWLHDTLEDTRTTRDELNATFGRRVGDIVWAVTGVGTNRRARNACMFEKIKAFPGREALTVKLADRIANVSSSDPGSTHRTMYTKEWPDFLCALWTADGPMDLWATLGLLFPTHDAPCR